MPETVPHCTIEAVKGESAGTGKTLALGEQLIVGRKRGGLLLDDPLVSAEHIEIVFRKEGVWIRDLGSTNGTRLNGDVVSREQIKNGDEITLGSHVLHCRFEEAAHVVTVQKPWFDGAGATGFLQSEFEASTANGAEPPMVFPKDLHLPPGFCGRLKVVKGEDVGKEIPLLKANTLIGRHCGDLALEDSEVSRNHAQLEVFSLDMVFVTDLGSKNGTYHNGRRIEVAQVQEGDRIGCGRVEIQFSTGSQS